VGIVSAEGDLIAFHVQLCFANEDCREDCGVKGLKFQRGLRGELRATKKHFFIEMKKPR